MTAHQRKRRHYSFAKQDRALRTIKAMNAVVCTCKCHRSGEPNPHHGQPCVCNTLRATRSTK